MAEKIVFEGTVASKVTERLREDIISKKIEAGSRITIKEISERYGTSNMPVREAFRTLEGENLLEINAYKGATVLCIDETFVREIYGLLRALECLIYESALPYIDDELIDELKAVNEEIGLIAVGQTLSTGYIDLNTKFHGLIMSRGGNSKAIELYRYYHMLIRALRKSYMPSTARVQAVYSEHAELIAALENKDALAIKAAVDKHVGHAMENFLKVYAGQI